MPINIEQSSITNPQSPIGPGWTLDPTEAAVWRALSRRRGRIYAISRLALAREVELDPRQLQKVVHRLRVQHGLPIGSGADQPNGYWILDSAEELEAFRQEQRRKALGTLLAVARACNATLPDLLGQIRMEYEREMQTAYEPVETPA